MLNRFFRGSKLVLLTCLLALGAWMIAIEARAQITVKSARLDILPDDECWVFLNGHLIHETESIPGLQFNEPQTDLKVNPRWFKPCGENVLGIYFYDVPAGKTFVVYRLKIRLSDGSKLTLYSDGDEKILDVGSVYDAIKEGDKTWNILWRQQIREGVAYLSREPRLPGLWHTSGEEFDDSAWEGTGQCYDDNNATLQKDVFFEIGRFPNDYVPAIRPNVVGKDCDVDKAGGTFLVRETFEINPCADAKPKPVCPGWFINAGSGFHFMDKNDNKWIGGQVYGKDGNDYGRVIRKGKDAQMGRKNGNVRNTTEDNVYHTFAKPNGKGIKYRFDVKPGAYTVTLRFMEPQNRSRTLDVMVEGMPALENFNPFESAGGKLMTAVDKSFSVEVNDGSLDIEILGIKGKAIVSGVGVVCGATQPLVRPKQATPTPSPQPSPTPRPQALPSPRPTPVPQKAFEPPPLIPTPTPLPVPLTPTPIPIPTKTWTPAFIPEPIKKIDVTWKILSLYYNFKGLIFGSTEFRFNAFRKMTITKVRPGSGQDGGVAEYKAHVILLDGSEFDLKRFIRENPKTGEQSTKIVFLRGSLSVAWDFRDIKEIEVISGIEVFERRMGSAELRITMNDGTVHGGR